MSQGYTLNMVEANKTANARNLGVALGRACIKAGVSVNQVAEAFGVSRMAVYNWFKGVSHPNPKLKGDIQDYITSINKKK
jgi:DNA-binding XRE family transcriptional regulator